MQGRSDGAEQRRERRIGRRQEAESDRQRDDDARGKRQDQRRARLVPGAARERDRQSAPSRTSSEASVTAHSPGAPPAAGSATGHGRAPSAASSARACPSTATVSPPCGEPLDLDARGRPAESRAGCARCRARGRSPRTSRARRPRGAPARPARRARCCTAARAPGRRPSCRPMTPTSLPAKRDEQHRAPVRLDLRDFLLGDGDRDLLLEHQRAAAHDERLAGRGHRRDAEPRLDAGAAHARRAGCRARPPRAGWPWPPGACWSSRRPRRARARCSSLELADGFQIGELGLTEQQRAARAERRDRHVARAVPIARRSGRRCRGASPARMPRRHVQRWRWAAPGRECRDGDESRRCPKSASMTRAIRRSAKRARGAPERIERRRCPRAVGEHARPRRARARRVRRARRDPIESEPARARPHACTCPNARHVRDVSSDPCRRCIVSRRSTRKVVSIRARTHDAPSAAQRSPRRDPRNVAASSRAALARGGQRSAASRARPRPARSASRDAHRSDRARARAARERNQARANANANAAPMTIGSAPARTSATARTPPRPPAGEGQPPPRSGLSSLASRARRHGPVSMVRHRPWCQRASPRRRGGRLDPFADLGSARAMPRRLQNRWMRALERSARALACVPHRPRERSAPAGDVAEVEERSPKMATCPARSGSTAFAHAGQETLMVCPSAHDEDRLAVCSRASA